MIPFIFWGYVQLNSGIGEPPMNGPELAVVIEVPLEISAGKILKPIKGNVSLLGLMCDRMQKLVDAVDVIVLTGRRPEDTPYGNFAALRGGYLHRSDLPAGNQRMKGIVDAASGRRAKDFIFINARHPFADPGLLRQLADFHAARKNAYTRFDNSIPAWLGGEAFNTNLLMDAYLMAKNAVRLDAAPGEFIESEKEAFKSAVFNPRVRGRWAAEHSLANPQAETLVLQKIKLSPDPVEISLRDFLA